MSTHAGFHQRAATQVNASIYAIDPRGPDGACRTAASSCQRRRSDDPDAAGLERTRSAGTKTASRATACRRSPRRPAASPSSTPTASRTRSTASSSENSSYYVLAYYPPNPKRDGKFHKIEVRVNAARADRSLAHGLRQRRRASRRRRPKTHAAAGVARRAGQPDAGQRPRDEGVCGALQGNRAERLGAARRRAARPRHAARRPTQARDRVLRGRRARASSRRRAATRCRSTSGPRRRPASSRAASASSAG